MCPLILLCRHCKPRPWDRVYKSPGKEMEWQWQIGCQLTETPTRLQNGIVWDNSGTNWQLQFCLSFVFVFFFFSLSLLSLPLCVVAFEDSQLQYQKRALLSYSLFSNCNLLLLLSHTQFFRIQKIEEKSISCAGHADAHAYIQTDGYTDTRSKQTKSNNIKRHQSENQCPSWIVWCYRLFSAWLGMALIF